MNQSTAILLFSRGAAAEARAKAFGPGQRVAEGLIRRTERKLARTGLPVIRSDESNQQGSGFGERLAHAVQEVFDRGYARVIVVGNDCTSIQTSHLRSAAQQLETGKQVLGPDRRGGAWLIGLQRETFEAEGFRNLRWETAGLYEDLTAFLPGVVGLAKLHDVNSLGDLRRLWTVLRTQLGHLYALIFRPIPVFAGLVLLHERTAVLRTGMRGPPCTSD